MPAHSHLFAANAANGTVQSPSGADLAQGADTITHKAVNTYCTPPMTAPVMLDPATVQSGGSQPHSNVQPLQGIFPSRS